MTVIIEEMVSFMYQSAEMHSVAITSSKRGPSAWLSTRMEVKGTRLALSGESLHCPRPTCGLVSYV